MGRQGEGQAESGYHSGLQSPPWLPLPKPGQGHAQERSPKTLFLYMQVNKHIFFTKKKKTSEFISVLLLKENTPV